MSFEDDYDYKTRCGELSEEIERALDFIKEIQGEKEKLKLKNRELKKKIKNLAEISRYLLSAKLL